MNPSASLTLYTGRAAVLARLAAGWLSRMAEWLAVGGPLEADGLALCRANHARCVRLAREVAGAKPPASQPDPGGRIDRATPSDASHSFPQRRLYPASSPFIAPLQKPLKMSIFRGNRRVLGAFNSPHLHHVLQGFS